VNNAFVIAVALAFCAAAFGQTAPDWAYPPLPAHLPDPSPELLQVPGSARQFTQGQIDRGYEVADWYPDEHPPMPKVVSNGRQAPVRACAMCHLPSGNGHPESGGLAGLPQAYIIAQMRAYVNGGRIGSRAASMVPIASCISEADLVASAAYFAALRPTGSRSRPTWHRCRRSRMGPSDQAA